MWTRLSDIAIKTPQFPKKMHLNTLTANVGHFVPVSLSCTFSRIKTRYGAYMSIIINKKWNFFQKPTCTWRNWPSWPAIFLPELNTLTPRRNENVWISIKISLKFVPEGPINNIPALVQIMARCRPGDKPLSEPMLVSLLTHICVTWPQWVNRIRSGAIFRWILAAILNGVAYQQKWYWTMKQWRKHVN